MVVVAASCCHHLRRHLQPQKRYRKLLLNRIDWTDAPRDDDDDDDEDDDERRLASGEVPAPPP